MFDGILFDLDGTLWDAVPEITASWNKAIAAAGVERAPLAVPEVRSWMGLLIGDIAARCLPQLPEAERLAIMDACVAEENVYLSAHGAAVYPGAEEVLEELARACPLFVVSNCQDGYIQAFFQGTGMGKYFTDFECAGRTGRPKSENIARMVHRHGLKRPVYVGDTVLDCASAWEAGVPFIHAAYGFGRVEGVSAVHSFGELPAALAALD